MSPGLATGVLDHGRHLAFAWWAYGVSGAVLAAAAAESVLRARRWRRRVLALEAERDPRTRPGEGA